MAAPGRSRTALSDAMNEFLKSRIALVDPRTALAGSRTTLVGSRTPLLGSRTVAVDPKKTKLLASNAASVAGVVFNENGWFDMVI